MAKRILVPLRQTQPPDSFLAAVGDLARGAGATVRLLHVAPMPGNLVNDEGRVVAYSDQEMARLDAETRDWLETIVLALDGAPIEPAVRFGEPVEEILAEADAFGADLIAMPVGPRPRLRLVGGVAAQVYRRAGIPVALLRAGRHEAVAD
ncbi:MAG TPA: universal stress protein [Methylomirabilota bacterium]|nr:universal stress protein [Methylomirabilota bacterium]